MSYTENDLIEAAQEHAKTSATIRSPEFSMLLVNAIHAEKDKRLPSIDDIVTFADAFAEQRSILAAKEQA